MNTVRILLVEDNPADADLTRETLADGAFDVELTVASDGVKALDLLYGREGADKPLDPDLVLLDLNLPRLDGRRVLSTVKSDPTLRRTPVVIMTTSRAESDIVACYDLGANCYIAKPVDLDGFQEALRILEEFWFSVVCLPDVLHKERSWGRA